ncbi:MAG: hypothetical protein MUQ30_05635 [Anaerolineae bacterium]|nr:hypothetical protein [Anaerolineae bacterium]
MGVDVKGLDRMRINMRKRIKNAEDPKNAVRDFVRYFSTTREPSRRRNAGVIKGKYGKGSKKWSPNMPSTVRGKGHSRVLYSGPSRSDLLDGLEIKWTTRRGSAKQKRDTRVHFRIVSDKEYSTYLHDGRHDMVARDIFTFYDGDALKVLDLAIRRSVDVNRSASDILSSR